MTSQASAGILHQPGRQRCRIVGAARLKRRLTALPHGTACYALERIFSETSRRANRDGPEQPALVRFRHEELPEEMEQAR
jgi:hypothetical protein